MRQVRALLMAIALAATACSGDSDTAPEAGLSPAESSLAPGTEQASASVSVADEAGEGSIRIETELAWGTEPITGTFEVVDGIELLGCGSGSVLEEGSPEGLTNEFTCEGGSRDGTFTIQWKILPETDGPGEFNGPWRVLDATGDFAGLAGEGVWSGVSDETTGHGSFPGVIEFGAVDDTEAQTADGSVEAYLSDQLEDVWIPEDLGSVMVAIVEPDGKVVHASRTADADAPVIGPDDLFRVGSITKVFTSALTLTLVEEGLVNLDAPAGDYITRMAVPDGVTVRHLLGHRSGIFNYTNDDEFFEQAAADDGRVWTPEEMFAIAADEPAEFEPGEEFGYSNTNYILLGTLIEEVTGATYDETLRSRILEPAAMTDTYVAGIENGADVAVAYSSFFTGALEPITTDYTSIATGAWSAGALVSSPADLHLFFTALFSGELISEKLLDEMITGPEGYGLGIAINPMELSEGLYGHGGSIMGFNTMVMHAPETGRTGFWVGTSDSADPYPAIVGVAPLLEAETLETGIGIASDDDGPASDAEANPVLDSTVAAYSAMFGSGDADMAWDTVSERCQGVIDESEFREAVAFVASEAPELVASNISSAIDGDEATVSYDTSSGLVGSYTDQPWVFADGNWYWDAC